MTCVRKLSPGTDNRSWLALTPAMAVVTCCPMGFAGNLRTLSLPEVVQTLARIQATGVLRLAADEGHRDVVFNVGVIVGVEFAQGAERQALLQRMIMQGKLDATAAAAITATGSETQVVRSLVDQGLVSEEEVSDAQASQAEEELISLCTWESADFVFHDASPEEPEASDLVAKWEKLGLTINSGSLLMEAARRMDEWSRLKEKLPDPSVVLGVANGQDEGLAKASAEYPAVAVIPLVDAVRTIEDIVKDAVVTRLDVYTVLVKLLELQLVCQLSREDLIAHADYWKEQHNNQLAAKLYRRSLALFPSDRDTQIKLGACLEYIGDQDEAAQCYGQLARGCLDEGDPGRAAEFARHAVSLRTTDPKLRQILARCHFMRGDSVAAVAELKEITKIYLELGQLEDARGTCLKILEISKVDEFARRELARIFSRVERDQQSEDVVMCVQCGAVNHREAQQCTECKASLQLGCLSCGRVVAVSDKLCIFCGANPHAGGSARRGGGSPTTSRIINRKPGNRPSSSLVAAVQAEAQAPHSGQTSGPRPAESGAGRPASGTMQAANDDGTQSASDRYRAELEQHLGMARANEEAGNYEAALTAWREVSKLQSDNPQILAHIRELELQVNQLAIENHIDNGHRFARTRHPWRAAKSYRSAIHLMRSDDPRMQPVHDALVRTERDQRKIGMLYGGALVLLAVCGFLAARPYYQIHRFRDLASQIRPRVEAFAALPPEQRAEEQRSIVAAIDGLAADAENIRGAYGTSAKGEANELRTAFYSQRAAAAAQSLESIAKVLQARNVAESDRLIAVHDADFGSEFEPQKLARHKESLAQLRNQLKLQADERKIAPQKLAAAEKQEEDKRFGSAIAAFRELATSSDPEVAAKAHAGVKRLAGREEAFLTQWGQATAMAAVDVVKCDQALAALADQARLWGREGEQISLRQSVQGRLKDAEVAYAALPTDAGPADLENFISAHVATPQIEKAKGRLSTVLSRLQGRDQALALYHQQIESRQYELAWQTGRDLIAGYGNLLQPNQVSLPLVIETDPAGAQVSSNGKVIGRSPIVMTWRPAYAGQPGDTGDLIISAPGWQSRTVALNEAGVAWRQTISLQRQALWQVGLGKTVNAAYRMPDGSVLMLAGDALASLDMAGRVRWRHGLGSDDLGSGRARLSHMPAIFPDGKLAFGLPGKDVAIVDAKGASVIRIATNDEVRGRPLVYTNDVFGADTRLAIAAESLLSGVVGGQPLRIPLTSAAISGPLAFDRDLDKVLVIGTVSGHLVGIQEQSKKTVWDIDLQASDISQLLPVADGLIATVLDGSKLVVIQVRADISAISWSHQLKAPAVGEPAVTSTGLVIAAGNAVLRFGLDGTTATPWQLPSPASSPVAAAGDVVAVGTQGGTLHVFKGGQQVWMTPCGQPVTAVAVLKDRVVVGLQDGSVIAFGL